MINWGKALANGGVAFFTTLAGLLTRDVLMGTSTPAVSLIIGALVSAGIMSGLAICTEWKKEEDNPNPGKKGSVKVRYFTLF